VEQLLGGDTAQEADTAVADTALAADQPGPLSTMLYNGSIPGEFLVPEEDFLLVDSLLHMQEAQRVLPRGRELIWASEPISQGARSYRPLYSVQSRAVLSGEQLSDARATIDPTSNQAIVLFELTRSGGRTFRRETRQHVNDYMAIMLDGRVFRQPPIIRSEIGRSGQIELGNASLQEAQDLALVLRAGALPAPLVIVARVSAPPSWRRPSSYSSCWPTTGQPAYWRSRR
jgi:hypothetical protein